MMSRSLLFFPKAKTIFASIEFQIQYVVLGPRKSPMPLVRVFSENDKIFRLEKKYVE